MRVFLSHINIHKFVCVVGVVSGVGKVKDVVIVGTAKGDASVVGVVARVVSGVVGVVRVVVSDRVWWDQNLCCQVQMWFTQVCVDSC